MFKGAVRSAVSFLLLHHEQVENKGCLSTSSVLWEAGVYRELPKSQPLSFFIFISEGLALNSGMLQIYPIPTSCLGQVRLRNTVETEINASSCSMSGKWLSISHPMRQRLNCSRPYKPGNDFCLHKVVNTADSTGRSSARRSASSKRGFSQHGCFSLAPHFCALSATLRNRLFSTATR